MRLGGVDNEPSAEIRRWYAVISCCIQRANAKISEVSRWFKDYNTQLITLRIVLDNHIQCQTDRHNLHVAVLRPGWTILDLITALA